MNEKGILATELVEVIPLEEGTRNIQVHGQILDHDGADGETRLAKSEAKAEAARRGVSPSMLSSSLSFAVEMRSPGRGAEVLVAETKAAVEVVRDGGAGGIAGVHKAGETEDAEADGDILAVGQRATGG